MPEGLPRVVCNELTVEIAGRRLIDAAELTVDRGEVVALMGPSGSGKTTLLHCLAGLRAPTSGRVILDGRDLASLDENERARTRLSTIGLVLQFGELVSELTVAENVALPLLLLKRPDPARVEEALSLVGMDDRLTSWPKELSGGETQRVGLARAIVTSPRVLLADEPTGSVDEERSEMLMDLLVALTRSTGVATLIATHDSSIAARADRILSLRRERLCTV